MALQDASRDSAALGLTRQRFGVRQPSGAFPAQDNQISKSLTHFERNAVLFTHYKPRKTKKEPCGGETYGGVGNYFPRPFGVF